MLQTPTLFAYIPSMPLGLLDYMNTASISVAMPIYAGGQIVNGNKLAKLGKEVSVYQKKMTTDEVLIKTEELFWTLQYLNGKEKTIQSYQLMLDSLSRDVNNYNQAGLAQRNDLLKVQLKQNELNTNLAKLQNGIELTKRALCQHIGLTYDPMLVFKAKPLFLTTSTELTNPSQMVQNRTEYQLLNKAVEAQRLQKKMAIGEYLPQVALVGTGFTYDAMENNSSNALAMVSVSIPISDWWGGSHKIKRQNIEMEKAKSALNENTELMILQIRKAENEVQETEYQIQVSQQSVEQAMENLRISEDNYESGTIGISDLLEAQAIYQQAVDSYTEALCTLQIKLAKHKQTIGTYN